MTDLSASIVPKSDQMNSDDLISGPRTIKITKVTADQGSAEQPILVFYEGDNGKPFKPCKSMRRVMVTIWGSDGAAMAGKAMTLYRDPDVTWGGMKVGGIRISHMSDMQGPVTMALTATKQSRKPFTVQPLVLKEITPIDAYAKELGAHLKSDDLATWWAETAERRKALAIPADRLKSMRTAVDGKLNPKTETKE